MSTKKQIPASSEQSTSYNYANYDSAYDNDGTYDV